ncbi:DUF2249 domain-containing protein [Vibrio hannami]|uniref:DUF2249 domain-containing protein n=1 Tax=Vibrio hannami TaxID=2717094 RepID=UPI00240FAD4E|nr:DUF2249 domain-containing protein [Vibrio hannami]MDG3084874.1 DUF2249 domain-containing protein [Vibrio hannami]
MVYIVNLDVSLMEPPQPMREICKKLESIKTGEVLHVTHRRKPVPLFEMLDPRFAFDHQEFAPDDHHIWFWLKDDSDAEQYIRGNKK